MARQQVTPEIVQLVTQKSDPAFIIEKFNEKYLNSHYPPVQQYFECLVRVAVGHHRDLIVHMLDSENNITKLNTSALQIILCNAVVQSDSEMVDLALTQGADVTKEALVHVGQPGANSRRSHVYNPIECALKTDDVSMLKKMLKKSNVTVFGKTKGTVLHFAAGFRTSPKCLEYLLSNPDIASQINVMDIHGRTPLLIAENNTQIIPVLLANGADVHAGTGKTTTFNNMNNLQLLSTRVTDETHTETKYNYIELAKMLIKSGLGVNAGSKKSESALCLLCDQPRYHIVSATAEPEKYLVPDNGLKDNLESEVEDRQIRQLKILVTGSDLIDCIRFVSAGSDNAIKENALEVIVNQLYYILNYGPGQRFSGDKLGNFVQVLVPTIKYIQDIILILLEHKTNVCNWTSRSTGLLDNIITYLYSAHTSNLMITDRDGFLVEYTKAVKEVGQIIKCLTAFREYVDLTQREKLTKLLDMDTDLYSQVIEIYIHDQELPKVASVLGALLEIAHDQNLEHAKKYLADNLHVVHSLKELARKTIVLYCGGRRYVEKIRKLPIPHDLQRYISEVHLS